jgi:ribosomal protein S18 acetylase RimI-like enzyme
MPAVAGERTAVGLYAQDSTMNIRPATRLDLQAIAALHIESCRDAYSSIFPAAFLDEQLPEHLRSHWRAVEIREEDVVLVAEDAALIGFAAVWCRPSPFIDNLHVRPSHRSEKVGTALMAAVAEQLISRGHKTAYLWVFESNSAAIRFYERLGGVEKQRAGRSVFGYDVTSRKIEWDDLNAILDRVR